MLLLLVLLPSVATARWYQVEVIVFKHAGDSAGSGEEWSATNTPPTYSNAIELATDAPDGAGEPAALSASVLPTPFKLLPRSERLLAEAERRLHNSREYQPLLGVEPALLEATARCPPARHIPITMALMGSSGHAGGEGEGLDATPLNGARFHSMTVDVKLSPVWLGHFKVVG